MRGRLSPRGYTIVEVMVFLAVSGFMFLIAIAFISGKQAKSEFIQGMNDANTQIQQVINDVSNGFYPNNNNFSCNAGSTGAPTASPIIAQQGTNLSCVFLGKIIQFQPADSSGTVNNSNYSIYSVAGRQYAPNSAPSPPASFNDAWPTIFTTPVDLTVNKTFEWGASVTGVYDNGVRIGAIGFFGSFGQQPGGNLQSGSQVTQVLAIPNVAYGVAESTGLNSLVSSFNASAEGAAMDTKLQSQPNPNITICFDSGNGQYGSIIIGGSITGSNSQNLSTSLQIGDKPSQVGC